jgi:hypothetical protein
VSGERNIGRNYTTQYRMYSTKDTRGYLSTRSSTRYILEVNYSIGSPTLDIQKSLTSKRRSVSNKSQRKEKEPDLVRREGMSGKIFVTVTGTDVWTLCEGRGDSRREEEDGREKGAVGPLEDPRSLKGRCLLRGLL